MPSVSIHLVVSDPELAIAWYTRVLGASETSRITLPTGKPLTIEFVLGDTTLALAGEFPDFGIVSPITLGGTYGALHVELEDVDAAWATALANGAREFEPLHDAFWGVRTGQFIDPFGHRWAIDHRLRDVPHDEVERLAAEAFGGAG